MVIPGRHRKSVADLRTRRGGITWSSCNIKLWSDWILRVNQRLLHTHVLRVCEVKWHSNRSIFNECKNLIKYQSNIRYSSPLDCFFSFRLTLLCLVEVFWRGRDSSSDEDDPPEELLDPEDPEELEEELKVGMTAPSLTLNSQWSKQSKPSVPSASAASVWQLIHKRLWKG